jgi:hypothetical protein
VGEAEVEQSAQVDDGGADAEAEPVAFDTAVADAAVSVSDEPGDGALDEWPPLPVVIDADPAAPVGTGGGEQLVVCADVEHTAGVVGGATRPHRAPGTAWPESGGPFGSDGHGDLVGTGDGAGGVVDAIVVTPELVVAEIGVAAVGHGLITAVWPRSARPARTGPEP